MINAAYISIKLWHSAHLETHERKVVSELMICSARDCSRPISPFSVDDHECAEHLSE
jgi:hypothetical protein